MSTFKSVLVTVFCCCFVVACSGEDKKEPAAGDKTGDKTGTDTDKKPVGETDKAGGPANKNLLGGLGGLMGGNQNAAATGGKKTGLLGGLLVGGMAGGKGAAPAGAAGTPAVAAADEGKMGKRDSDREEGRYEMPTGAAGKDCQAVGAHLTKIIEKEMKSGDLQNMDLPPEAAAQMGPMMVMACETQGWTPEAKACILKATDAASMESCESLIGGMAGADVDADDLADLEGLEGLEDIDLGALSADPAPSGDAECDKVAAHLVGVMLTLMPADQAKAMAQMKGMLQNEIAKECVKGPWPKSMKSCLLGATTEAAMEKCAAAAGMAN